MTITQRYAGPPGPEEDRYWMRRALAAAKRGLGATSPNPPVGSVLVKNGICLAQGHHRRAGLPHAEIEVLSQLKDPAVAKGGTLYITLEPCSTQGRTPPCTESVLRSGVSRVVFGSIDPNPAHAGRAERMLRKAGIEVSLGILRQETDELLRIFKHWILYGRPYIIAKAGLSLDGCITRPPGESSWLTSREARRDAQQLRILADAILVGAETIRQDNPKLTVRHSWIPPHKRPLRRYVLTRSGNLPETAHVFTDALAEHTCVIREARWPDWLDTAAADGITSILLEGGGATLTEALHADAVQELHVYLAPLISGSGANVIRAALGDRVILKNVQSVMIGDHVKVSALLEYHD